MKIAASRTFSFSRMAFSRMAFSRFALPRMSFSRGLRHLLCASLSMVVPLRGVLADQHIATLPAAQGRPVTMAGEPVLDAATGRPASGALPVAFVRSPDTSGPDGGGRYLIAVNSGFGEQFNAATNRAQQSLAVIDLSRTPAAVVQHVYFPAPQSANVGAVFGNPRADGSALLYVAGGFENKIWIFNFRAGDPAPITPAANGPATSVSAPSIDLSMMSRLPASAAYNDGRAAVYPTGIAIARDGAHLYTANNLDDSLGIVGLSQVNSGAPQTLALSLASGKGQGNLYPFDVAVTDTTAYVSLWGAAALAIVDLQRPSHVVRHVNAARHPTALLLNRDRDRLYVVNSDADLVTVLDTRTDKVVSRIDLRLAEHAGAGGSPEGLALSADERRLFVACAHSNAIAVVALAGQALGTRAARTARKDAEPDDTNAGDIDDAREHAATATSHVIGFVPSGPYPAAVAVVGNQLFVGVGKSAGNATTTTIGAISGLTPNVANAQFPAAARGRAGQYILSLVAGSIAHIDIPDAERLSTYSTAVMRNNGLVGDPARALFANGSPIKHIIYIIRENRTYDQVLGDLPAAGNGQAADGDPALAIFGTGAAARIGGGPKQDITPNMRALALRFGLLDRFFVNAEASPDGHNWSTAAFSNDYVDKAMRWNYSGRGRSYDFDGFNRLPDVDPPATPLGLRRDATAHDVASYLQRFVPYLQGAQDIGEPATLYLWDAAARAHLSYRNYGEYVATITARDVEAIATNKRKSYPDTSAVVASFATKRSLEQHFSATFPNFDTTVPDAMTAASFTAAAQHHGDALIAPSRNDTANFPNADPALRGTSRLGAWLQEFAGYVAARKAGEGNELPNLSILRFSSDHTAGMTAGMPTPQFMVADNDYALGRLVEAVSASPYWRDTAIFVVEDDAQAGPDHVDAHRSPALVISAYNRKGALVHEFHNTVSLIRTMEVLLGMPPMNQLDAVAAPIDLFQATPDLTPFTATLPNVAMDNLITRKPLLAAARYWSRRSAALNVTHADMADPQVLNEAIWFSVRGAAQPMPQVAALPAFTLMPGGDREAAEATAAALAKRIDMQKRRLIAAHVAARTDRAATR